MSNRLEITNLTSNLITAITGISLTDSVSNHKTCLDFALKTFRTGKYGSTDHFLVKEAFDGLEEKFRVKDNDELADELKARVEELDKIDESVNVAGKYNYTPEILKLLLELSDKPAENSNAVLVSLDDLVKNRKEEQLERERRLAEEEKAELMGDDDEGIWAMPDFAASSSDDSDWGEDEFTKQAEKKERKKAAKKRAETEEKLDQASSLNVDDYIRVAHAAATQSIELAQYWSRQTVPPVDVARDFVSYGYTQSEIEDLWMIGELHVIREVIFALYGLPSSLFKFQDDGSINVIAKYVIDNTSPGSLNDILDYFASKAVILQKLRTFSKFLERRCEASKLDPTIYDAIAPAQSFVEAIQTAIKTWELESLVPIEEQFIRKSENRKDDVMVSLLQLQSQLDPSLDHFTPLYEIVIALERGLGEQGLAEPAARVSFHLELLFKKTCEAESNGRQEIFKFLRGIFLPCLRTYLRPICKWMELGELREEDGQGAFFVHLANEDDEDEENTETAQLARLWHGQYVLDRDERDVIVAPSFIREYGKKIFVTGKSVLFLRKLGEAAVEGKSGLPEVLEGLSMLSTADAGRSLTSFGDALLIAMSDWVARAHKDVSAKLRDILYYECGLWDSLQGLVDVYFMRDGFAVTAFCNTLFERIDKGHKKWDDRFLLTELIQSVYSENYNIDISRLSVKSKRQEMNNTAVMVLMQGQKRSVKVLSLLAADYRLSWPIMNVVTPESVDTCRKIWGFLLMIRRARTSLEKMRLGKGKIETLVCSIRWRLLTFISLLHSFLVDLVLRPQVESMKNKLSEAADIDEMIDVQEEHFKRIEDLCLLSTKLAPLYQAVMSVLDMAVLFANEQNSKKGITSTFDLSNRSIRNISFRGSINPIWQAPKPRQNKDSDEDSEEESEEATDSEGDDASDDDSEDEYEKNRRKRENEINNSRMALSRLSAQVHKMILFLTTGLRSMARAGVYSDTIEILAERLEMGAIIDESDEEDEEDGVD